MEDEAERGVPGPEGEASTSSDTHEWLTLAQAAKRLGLSTDRVRRRLKAGEFEAQQVSTRHGPAWQIRAASLGRERPPLAAPLQVSGLPTVPTTVVTPTVGTTMAQSSTDVHDGLAVAELVNLLHEEREQLRQERERSLQMAQAAAMWQERARNLESQVEQLLALPAHEEEPVPGRRWWQWWHRKAE